jgi:cytochrome P450
MSQTQEDEGVGSEAGPVEWPLARRCPIEPPPELATVREQDHGLGPIGLPTGIPCQLASSYDSVRAVLTHPAISAETGRPGFPHMSEAMRANRGSQASFVRMDPPKHDVHRRMLTADFAVRKVRDLVPDLETYVDQLLEAMAVAPQPVDLVTAFCEPIPGMVISSILGLPDSEREFLQGRLSTYSGNNPPDVIAAANQEVLDYLDGAIGERIEEPRGDLIGRLVQDQMLEGEITRPELVQMLHLLVFAGFDTTANMIALGTVALTENPEQLSRLKADESLCASAVEELLRYLSVAHMSSARVSVGDVEVGGQTFPAGTGFIASTMAANHDPEHFEDPATLDVTRDARSHLAFGAGVHACLGQALARAELKVVFPKLFGRFPDLALATPMESLTYKSHALVYGVDALPVHLFGAPGEEAS